VLDIFSKAFGHKYNYVDVPEAAAHKAMSDMQMPKWMVDGMMELHYIIKAGWSATPANGVKEVLGRPARTVKDFATDYAAGKR
jgi:hypothetical protein